MGRYQLAALYVLSDHLNVTTDQADIIKFPIAQLRQGLACHTHIVPGNKREKYRQDGKTNLSQKTRRTKSRIRICIESSHFFTPLYHGCHVFDAPDLGPGIIMHKHRKCKFDMHVMHNNHRKDEEQHWRFDQQGMC